MYFISVEHLRGSGEVVREQHLCSHGGHPVRGGPERGDQPLLGEDLEHGGLQLGGGVLAGEGGGEEGGGGHRQALSEVSGV